MTSSRHFKATDHNEEFKRNELANKLHTILLVLLYSLLVKAVGFDKLL